jgi:hypothetical protein
MRKKFLLTVFCALWVALCASAGRAADTLLRHRTATPNAAEPDLAYAVPEADGTAAERKPQLGTPPGLFSNFAYFVDKMGSNSLPCNTTEDAGRKLQAIIDAVPDESTLIWPMNCATVLGTGVKTGGSAITINRRIGLRFVSMGREQNFGGTSAPRFLWAGAGGTMFNINRGFNITFEGFAFRLKTGSETIDTFLEFDQTGAGSNITTGALVQYNSFNAVPQKNPNFAAVSIARVGTSNQENMTVSHNQFACSASDMGRRTNTRPTGSISSGRTTVTCTGCFQKSDVGKYILLSWATGAKETTVATFVSANEITVASAPADTQSNVTVHVGRAYGNGIYLAASTSLNTLNEIFDDNNYYWCHHGIRAISGQFNADGVHGFGNDMDVSLVNIVGRSVIQNLQSENSVRSVDINNPIGPIVIDGDRGSNGVQRADGWIYVSSGGLVSIRNSRVNYEVPTNGVWFGHPANSTVYVEFQDVDFNNIGSLAKTGLPSINLSDMTLIHPRGLGSYEFPHNYFASFNDQHSVGLSAHAQSRNYAGAPIVGIKGQADFWIHPNGGGSMPDEAVGIYGLSGTGGSDSGRGDLYGVRGELTVSGGWRIGAAIDAKQGTLQSAGATAAYSVRANGPTSVSGTLANNYGLYIGKHKVTNVTNGWGVYQADAADKNFFGGSINMGSLTASRIVATDANKNLTSLSAGLTATIRVRKGDNSGACDIVVSAGIITSTTC